jgi:hypothetical protein
MAEHRISLRSHEVRLLVYALDALRKSIAKQMQCEREPALDACFLFADQEASLLKTKLDNVLKGTEQCLR